MVAMEGVAIFLDVDQDQGMVRRTPKVFLRGTKLKVFIKHDLRLEIKINT